MPHPLLLGRVLTGREAVKKIDILVAADVAAIDWVAATLGATVDGKLLRFPGGPAVPVFGRSPTFREVEGRRVAAEVGRLSFAIAAQAAIVFEIAPTASGGWWARPFTVEAQGGSQLARGEDELVFSDELVWAGSGGGSNRHRPRLVFQAAAGIVPFEGRSIPGVARVLTSEYCPNGKWSYTTYRLSLAPSVTAWTNAGGRIARLGRNGGLEARHLTRWADAASVPQDVVRRLFPRLAARLDEADQPV